MKQITPEEAVSQLRAFYAHATGPKGLGQYEDEDGNVTDYYRYDHHLGDIETDAFELIGRLVAQLDDTAVTVTFTPDEADCVLWAMSDRDEPEDGDWNPPFLTALDKLGEAMKGRQ